MSNIYVIFTSCAGDGFLYNGDPCNQGTGQGCLLGYEQGGNTNYRPYESSHRLESYFYEVNFAGTHGNGKLKIQSY